MPEDPLVWSTDDWDEMLYTCSRTQEYMLTSLLNLKYSVERDHHHTMLRSISGRLKTRESIEKKLVRYRFEVSPASACQNLHDIIGLRIICSYIDDIYSVVEVLNSIDHYRILEVKDYIKHPKKSGYRSLHVIGLCTAVQNRPVLCEIQLRTTAMDSWAALEHQLRYKKNLPDSEYVNRELLECATMLNQTDVKMQRIHRFLDIQNHEDTGSGKPDC
ncbi:GTP pyrophosphokinase family protein [Erysipelotrichaceae bacterium 51-3]|uniref:GTP pyrophosphokinase n=1 Tax=Allobaculum sp. JKK-2023 TaxID=3108943 RepID=UPI002B05A5FA|nr:GTP pyrophosphokinase family protein [Allobaculum sp. JKK-2023]